MDKILKKLFTKYFIYKIQADWKEELKKIPTERLKKWMDEELFVKIDEECENLALDVISDCDRKWDNEIWMEINDFVNNIYMEDQLEDEVDPNFPDVPEEYWDSEEDDNPLEGLTMICPDEDEHCNKDCEHAVPHEYESGCEVECGFSTTHRKCAIEEEEDEIVPDEITETGGI